MQMTQNDVFFPDMSVHFCKGELVWYLSGYLKTYTRDDYFRPSDVYTQIIQPIEWYFGDL